VYEEINKIFPTPKVATLTGRRHIVVKKNNFESLENNSVINWSNENIANMVDIAEGNYTKELKRATYYVKEIEENLNTGVNEDNYAFGV